MKKQKHAKRKGKSERAEHNLFGIEIAFFDNLLALAGKLESLFGKSVRNFNLRLLTVCPGLIKDDFRVGEKSLFF